MNKNGLEIMAINVESEAGSLAVGEGSSAPSK